MNDETIARLQVITYALVLVIILVFIGAMCMFGGDDVLLYIAGGITTIWTVDALATKYRFHREVKKFEAEINEDVHP